MAIDWVKLFDFIREMIVDCRKERSGSLGDAEVCDICRKQPLRRRIALNRALRAQGFRGQLESARQQVESQLEKMTDREIMEFASACYPETDS